MRKKFLETLARTFERAIKAGLTNVLRDCEITVHVVIKSHAVIDGDQHDRRANK